MPWTIIPYWSLHIFFALSLFICRSKDELDTLGSKLLTAQVIAVVCFVVFPLRYSFVRPDLGGIDGIAGVLFAYLEGFDKPFNQAPSLHISTLVMLWVHYLRRLPPWGQFFLHLWFGLIAVSVLTTYQHHFIDIPTGALLGLFCLWLFQSRSRPLEEPQIEANHRR